MAINKIKWKDSAYVIICLGLLLLSSFNGIAILTTSTIHSSDATQTLIDKIYTFSAPTDNLEFEEFYFYEEFTYYLILEIVTPHNCAINITLTDPDLFKYRIFETKVNISQDDGWFEVPFGTAINGNYSISIEVITALTLNIHIELEKGHKCLYDVIPTNLLNTMKFYEVSRYTDGMKYSHNVQLRSDYSYKFYIERVSSIGGLYIEREVEIFYNLTDPDVTRFQIYFNVTLLPIGSVLSFDFGTAVGGLYTFEMLIYCKVDCVNIAYAIAEDYRISEEVNDSTPPPNSLSNNTIPRGIIIMPFEFMLTMGIVCGGLVLTALIMVSRRRKKNSIRRIE